MGLPGRGRDRKRSEPEREEEKESRIKIFVLRSHSGRWERVFEVVESSGYKRFLGGMVVKQLGLHISSATS